MVEDWYLVVGGENNGHGTLKEGTGGNHVGVRFSTLEGSKGQPNVSHIIYHFNVVKTSLLSNNFTASSKTTRYFGLHTQARAAAT
jgi:hypothetical protein